MTSSHDQVLPEGTRLLHIGPPKTATTALQAAFHANRRSVERQGVHYAGRGRHAMTSVLAGLDLPSPWSDQRKPPPRRTWDGLLANIRSSAAARVVLSSEFFADASPAAIARVVRELDPARIHVVSTLRPLAKIIPSQWQQYVQGQYVGAFDEWLDGILNQPPGKVTPSFWRRHRHDRLIARWAEVVGPERVTVVALDDRDREMVFRVFEGLTGLTTGTLVAKEDLTNRSMTLPEIEVVRAFNVAYLERKLPQSLYGRVMRFGGSAWMRTRTPEPDEPRIELPDWATEPIARIAREMMDAIRASGVRVIGDLDGLTAVPDGREPAVAPVTVSPAVAASAALGILVASGLARGTGRITADESDALEGDDEVARPQGADRPPRPVQEPPELLRVSTPQLATVIYRRTSAALVDAAAGVIGRRRD